MFNLEKTPFHRAEAVKILCMSEKEIQSILGGKRFPENIICFYRPRAGFNFSNIYDIFSIAVSNLNFDSEDIADVEDCILQFIDKIELNVTYSERIGQASTFGIIGEISEKFSVDPLCKIMRDYARLGEYYLNHPGMLWEASRREKIYACILVLLFHRAIPVFLSDDFGSRDSKTITIANSNVALMGEKALPYLPLSELLPEVPRANKATPNNGIAPMRN